MGDVTVSPGDMLPSRGAGGIEHALLSHQHKWAIGQPSIPRGLLGRGNLGQCSAEMDRSRAPAHRCPPGDWLAQGPIDLKRAGAVAVARQLASIARVKTIPRKLEELSRGHIAEHGTRRW